MGGRRVAPRWRHAPLAGAYSGAMSAAERLVLSYDEYLALEASTGLRHQYIDGVAYAMAGSEPEHASVTANAIVALGLMLRGGRCRVYSSDLKVRVPETGNAYYADAAVVCGRFTRHPGDPIAVTNPTLLVEVLSPSTETFDRGDKFADYQRLASLRHYLLVSTRTQRVEHYRRNDDGTWTLTVSEAGGLVQLPDLGGAIEVDELYVGEVEERADEG